MTKEEKQLLLTDLCTRLPYGVICDCLHDYHTKASAVDAEDLTIYYPYCDEWESIEHCKPYLRPMSSMTEEECIALSKLIPYETDAWKYIKTPIPLHIANIEQFDFFHRHHFDWRGLISKGLAIEVTEENNPYKK